MAEGHFGNFFWSIEREHENLRKHGVTFSEAVAAFLDPARKVFMDAKHSTWEGRFFCIGKVGDRVLTVRFIYRNGKIRIFGAGYWRKGRIHYEEKDA